MNQYVAIKHNGSIDVNDAYITDGSTSCLVSDIPNDFEPHIATINSISQMQFLISIQQFCLMQRVSMQAFQQISH